MYSLTSHNRRVYLTLPECFLLYGLMGLGYGGGIASVTMWVRWKLGGRI